MRARAHGLAGRRAGRRTGPGQACCVAGAWSTDGVSGRRARPGEQGAEGAGSSARQRRKERERGRGKEREKKKKKKKLGKRKRRKRKKEGREIKRERERGASASAPIAAAVGHAWCPGARERDARVEGKQGAGYGCRVFGESKDLAE